MFPRLQSARGSAAISIWLCLTLAPASAQELPKKKPLAVEDLYLMESVKSPALFPKEDKLVYERVWIDAKTKTERHSLWLVTDKRENRKPLEKDEPDGRSPVVSPDGQWIAFLSNRARPAPSKQVPPAPPYSDAAVDIWMYHVKSAKVMPLGGAERPWGRVFHDGFYGRVAFSADSTKLVFVADDGADPRTKEEIANDVEIVRPDQGEGYTGYQPAQIWVAELQGRAEPREGPGGSGALPGPLRGSARQITRLTNDDVWYGDPQWSPDGKSIVVHANKTKDRESVRFSINKNFDLFLVDVASKKQTQLTDNPGPDASPRFSPDGKQIAYLSVPRNGAHRDAFNLYVLTLTDGQVRRRVIFENHYRDRENRDTPSFPLPENCWAGPSLLWFRVDSGTKSSAMTFDLLAQKQSQKLFTSVSRQDQRREKIAPPTNINLTDRFPAKSDGLRWRNNGFDIEAIFTTPPPEVATPPYKVIVYPHGGPHSRSTIGFDFTVQLFASQGYAVFQPNFRGSSGYGQEFVDADRFDLGGGDMQDILTGIDKLVKDGKVDPKRQFVYGISYGGFMTSWLVGQTHQFRAAVAQNAVTDMNMMYGLSDLQSWTTWELGGLPWEQPQRYRKHSPLTYADKVKTPTLILHARDDRRCPLPMGKAFHQALLANEVPTQMVIYPNEGHGIRAPRHREDVYRRVLAWFAKYDE